MQAKSSRHWGFDFARPWSLRSLLRHTMSLGVNGYSSCLSQTVAVLVEWDSFSGLDSCPIANGSFLCDRNQSQTTPKIASATSPVERNLLSFRVWMTSCGPGWFVQQTAQVWLDGIEATGNVYCRMCVAIA